MAVGKTSKYCFATEKALGMDGRKYFTEVKIKAGRVWDICIIILPSLAKKKR